MHLADIIGIGHTKTAEHWEMGIIDLAVEAAGYALAESPDPPTAVVVGNALGSALGDQRNLASFIAARLGFSDIETITVEADEASGGAAVRQSLALIGSGMHERVLAIGVEKTSDVLPDGLEAARASGLDVLREAGFGFSLPVAAALTMQKYISTFGVDRADFYHLSALAHAHGALNEDALFSWPLSKEQYLESQMVSDPVTICDTAPACDGAAAALLSRDSGEKGERVRIMGSSSKSVRPGIAGPALNLTLPAASVSASEAMAQAEMKLGDISLFELHDSSTIMAALSLESVGLAQKGGALKAAASGDFSIEGKTPNWTFGGNKARGHAIGASGLYQIVEAAMQLKGEAGKNQVKGAKTALTQCLGSFGTTAITHVLRRC